MKIVIPAAYIAAVTNVTENHGEELVHATAIKIEAELDPAQLDEFSPALRGLLFVDDIPRIPELGAIHWKGEYEKTNFTITSEAPELEGGQRSLRFTKADVSKITIEAKPGYLIGFSASVKVYRTTEEAGQLADLHKHTVDVRLSKMTQKKIVEDTPPEGEGDKQPDLPEITPLRPDLSTPVH